MGVQGPADAAREPQVSARARVVEYYDHCWDDYRVLWRTDETGSVHFGFFDAAASRVRPLRVLGQAVIALAAVAAAGVSALLGGRSAAVPWLRVAARGRALRHELAQRRMTAECADSVALRAGDLVLDAGCGVGGTDLWLAQAYGVRVLGVNVQRMHIREALRNAANHPAAEQVRFSMQDFTELALASNAVDVVWGLESVCHCADKAAFVREAHRVLRPGGRLMVADFFLERDELSPRDAAAMRVWTDGWALPNLASVEGFGAMLAAQGFTGIVNRDIRSAVLPSSWRLYKASLLARPIHWLLEATGLRSGVAGANVQAAFHQYVTLRSGVWSYRVWVARK